MIILASYKWEKVAVAPAAYVNQKIQVRVTRSLGRGWEARLLDVPQATSLLCHGDTATECMEAAGRLFDFSPWFEQAEGCILRHPISGARIVKAGVVTAKPNAICRIEGGALDGEHFLTTGAAARALVRGDLEDRFGYLPPEFLRRLFREVGA